VDERRYGHTFSDRICPQICSPSPYADLSRRYSIIESLLYNLPRAHETTGSCSLRCVSRSERLRHDLSERNYNTPLIEHRKTTVRGFDSLYPLVPPASHQSVRTTQIQDIDYLWLVSDQIPAIWDASTIITHSRGDVGGWGRG